MGMIGNLDYIDTCSNVLFQGVRELNISSNYYPV